MEMTTCNKLKEVRINYPSYPNTYADYYELRIKRTHNTTKPSWAVWKSHGWGAEGECLVKGLTAQEAIDFRDNYKVEK